MGALDVALQFVRGVVAAVRNGGGGEEEDGLEKALSRADQFPPPVEAPKAMHFDPFALIDQMGYKERPSAITYYTLESMAMRDAVIGSVVQTRVNQLAAFAHKQRTPYDMGFRIKLRGSKRRPTSSEAKQIEKLENLVLNTGVVDGGTQRDDFETFMRKIARDSLVFDQACAEILHNRRGKPAAFQAIDASTIRLAEDWALQQDGEKRDDHVAYVQIYDGTVVAEFGPDDLIFGVRNPRTSIRQNGYGFSELEMLITTITAHLWAEEYNRKFFCVVSGTYAHTRDGYETLGDLHDRYGDQQFEVWTGCSWSPARVWSTGAREVAWTALKSGVRLGTSQEHRFYAIPVASESGLPEWIEQRDLAVGDAVLLAAECVESNGSQVPTGAYPGRGNTGRAWDASTAALDADLWEVLGWLRGDGYISARGHDGAKWRDSASQLFYHPDKELYILERHLATLVRLGVNARRCSLGQSTEVREKYGREDRPAIFIHHDAFNRWLYDVGFRPPRESKAIPWAVFVAPVGCRASFLRGLFSVDGCTNRHVTGYGVPTLAVARDEMRQGVVRLLRTLGVASTAYSTPSGGAGVRVQDVMLFKERVGYIQPYKNDFDRQASTRHRSDKCAPALQRTICKALKAEFADKFSRTENVYMNGVVRGAATVGRATLKKWCAVAELRDFDDVLRFQQTTVFALEQTDAREEMFDIEVLTDDESNHRWIADGVVVHNSSGSSIKGVLNIKGFVPDEQLKAFRRAWYSMVSGVSNAFRTPILNGEDIQWISMHQNNRDMEFGQWMEYLIKVACACFQISPDEVGFELRSSGAGGGGPLFESNNESRLRASRDKGLRPLIRAFFGWINQGIIWHIDSDFEIAAAGIDSKSEEQRMELATKAVHNYMTVDEIRADHDLSPLPNGKGDVVLDPTWLQFSQAKDMPQPGQEGGSNGGFGGDDAAPPAGGDGGLSVPGEDAAQWRTPEEPDDEGAPGEVPGAGGLDEEGEPLDGKSEDAPRRSGRPGRFVLEV